jgi:hypothetical protein
MANAYWVSGGNGNINSSTNWSTLSGGPSGYTPVAGDDLIVDINSLNAPMATISGATYESLTFSDYTGVFTLTAGTQSFRSGLIYSAGMTVTGTGTINIGDSSRTTGFVNFNGVTHSGSFGFNNGASLNTVYNITGDLNIIGTVSFSNSNGAGVGNKITINGGDVLCNSGFSIFNNGNRLVNGTSKIRFVGNGSGNFASGINAALRLIVIFEKTGGVINMTINNYYMRDSLIQYISGTFTNFSLSATVGTNTIDTNSMVWVSATLNNTNTLSSQLNVSGTCSVAGTINGTSGITCGNLTVTNSVNLPVGSTTNVSGTLTSVGTAAVPFTIGTVTSGQRANLILASTGNQDVAHTSGIDIDSDGGLPIMSYRAPSITNCDNWMLLPIITSINTNLILK